MFTFFRELVVLAFTVMNLTQYFVKSISMHIHGHGGDGGGWDHPPKDENFGEPPPLRRWTQGPGGW